MESVVPSEWVIVTMSSYTPTSVGATMRVVPSTVTKDDADPDTDRASSELMEIEMCILSLTPMWKSVSSSSVASSWGTMSISTYAVEVTSETLFTALQTTVYLPGRSYLNSEPSSKVPFPSKSNMWNEARSPVNTAFAVYPSTVTEKDAVGADVSALYTLTVQDSSPTVTS